MERPQKMVNENYLVTTIPPNVTVVVDIVKY